MAKLVKCKMCGKEIASTCKKCIHCGAKNQSSFGCGTLLIVLVVIAAISAAMSDSKPTPSAPAKQEETAVQKLEKSFAELKTDAAIEKIIVSENKIRVIYKNNDLPDMVLFKMRDCAATGTKITGEAFTAECSVSAEPDKILYSERRKDRRIESISYSENIHAKNKRAEKKRLTEAKRQRSAAFEKELADRAYTAFHNRFVSSWDGSCKPVVNAVKATMHNPDSFKHVKSDVFSVTGEKGMFIVEMTFRGTNAFGGTVTHKVSAKLTKDGTVIKVSPMN